MHNVGSPDGASGSHPPCPCGHEASLDLDGGALVGFHTAHRATQDLDLFWHAQARLEGQPLEVEQRLSLAGLSCVRLQVAPSFARVQVADEEETVVLDLVAEPVPWIEAPQEIAPGIFIDTRHEILVNKLTTLLQRSELRDLEDVRVLVSTGGDLDRALSEAPLKDSGFSSLTLAWLLRRLPLSVAADLGFDESLLAGFRDALVEKLSEYPDT